MSNKEYFNWIFSFIKEANPSKRGFPAPNTTVTLTDQTNEKGEVNGEFCLHAGDTKMIRVSFHIDAEQCRDEEEKYAHYLINLRNFLTRMSYMAATSKTK